MREENTKTFKGTVFPAELAQIQRRRETVGQQPLKESEPSADLGLVGLALSGGGIRSATFALGAIQGLAKAKVMKSVDYLSTVSGGGFIGSCLSSTLNRPGTSLEGEDFPFRYEAGQEEPRAMSRLRNSENYLAPGGMVDKLRIPTLMVRGVLVNLFLLIPFLMLAVFLTEIVYELIYGHFGLDMNSINAMLMLMAMLVFVALVLSFPFVSRLFQHRMDWHRRDRYEHLQTLFLLISVCFMLCQPLLFLVNVAIDTQWHEFERTLADPGAFISQQYWVWPLLFALILGFMFVGKASEHASRLRNKIILYLLGLSGPAFLFVVYLLLCVWQIDSPILVDQCTQECVEHVRALERSGESPAESNKWFLQQFQSRLDVAQMAKLKHAKLKRVHKTLTLRDRVGGYTIVLHDHDESTFIHAEYDTLNAESDADKPLKSVEGRWGNYVFNLYPSNFAAQPGLLTSNLLAFFPEGGAGQLALLQKAIPDHFFSRNSTLKTETIEWQVLDTAFFIRLQDGRLKVRGASDIMDGPQDYYFISIMILLFIINALLVDVNITSVHGFYRDRLSRAYLFQLVRKAGKDVLQPNDAQKLSELNQPETKGPYHLINVAMNLSGSSDSTLRGRNADFFVFSKLYVGGERTGYIETTALEAVDTHLNLGSAMAISGAAASPNMGTTTIKPLVFILTLLNIRLNYWLPNPAKLNQHTLWHKLGWYLRVGPTHLIKESLGDVNEDGLYVNVSDGGHLENLGVYELLKRHCKLIISVDGEADPDLHFTGLMTLIRYAKIDLGINIEIDLAPIRKDESGYSQRAWALGKIHYGSHHFGHFLYLKAAITRQETHCVAEYSARHPAFPHQSTANQFFREDQFEAYRALGCAVVEQVFAAKAGAESVECQALSEVCSILGMPK